jgi:hypothetical protein
MVQVAIVYRINSFDSMLEPMINNKLKELMLNKEQLISIECCCMRDKDSAIIVYDKDV